MVIMNAGIKNLGSVLNGGFEKIFKNTDKSEQAALSFIND